MLILTLLQAQPAAGPNPFGTVFMFGAIFLIFYFLLIRPQRKQQKSHDEMVKALSGVKGSRARGTGRCAHAAAVDSPFSRINAVPAYVALTRAERGPVHAPFLFAPSA